MTIDFTADQVRVLILVCTFNEPVQISNAEIDQLPAIRAKLRDALKWGAMAQEVENKES